MSSSSATHPDFASEQEFLHHAYTSLKAMRSNIVSLGDAGGDPKASAALKKHREKMLSRLDDPHSVCFGRLDLEDGERYYVGPQLIQDGGGLIVINWAADAARPFYEATSEDPMALDLRRRFRTERERLLGISDEVFGTGAAVQPTIADILLEELGRERTAEMRDIAATIQSDQYRIISRPLESPTVIQGGPGTGKTVVGLHRAAFLLYRHRRELVSSGVLVVGPNRLFMQYIAYVLPSLGETAADQVAVESLAQVTVSGIDDSLVAQVKGSERMAEVLRRAVVDRVRVPDEDLAFQANGIRFSVPYAEVSALVGDFDGRSATYLVARDRFRSTLERRVENAYAAAAEAATARQPELRVQLAIDARRIPTFDSVQERIWPAITAAELVRQLLSSEERLARAATDVLTETERRLLFRKPVPTMDSVTWTVADGPLVDEAQHLLDGGARRYGHVVLDEAQDLTPMQLHMVGRRIRGGSVTVLGDLAQTTGLWSYASWETINGHLGLDPDVEIKELTLAYRVPRQIMEIALPVLELTAPSIRPPVAFRDGGEAPVFAELSRADRAHHAVDTAAAAHASGGTAAIIAPTSCLPEIRRELERRGLEYGDAEQGELTDSIELLDPVAAKGLEFDHVVLVEPAAIIREASDGRGHQQLYVVLTRAMRTLVCLHCEPLPWPLGRHGEPAKPKKAVVATVAEPPTPTRATELAASPPMSVGEALVVARLRGIDLGEALARALFAHAGGASESEIAVAVLSGTSGSVSELLEAARRIPEGSGTFAEGSS